jgi:uncharacterized protein YgiB involved in biofilm formation
MIRTPKFRLRSGCEASRGESSCVVTEARHGAPKPYSTTVFYSPIAS